MKKILTTITAVLFILTFSCSSLFYDCADAVENAKTQCGADLDTTGMQTECESGNTTAGTSAWSDTDITCVATAESCPSVLACLISTL